jgi:hypothetical protein
MPKNPEIPLHLFQVLEEEYLSLHGPIPDEEPLLELPGDEVGQPRRPVKAARDWLFHEGHVKNAVGFAAEVLQFDEVQEGRLVASDASGAQDEWARRNLLEYLRREIDHKVLIELVEWGDGSEAAQPPADNALSAIPPREIVEPLEEALNKLLNDAELYDGDRFADDWLSAATKGLVEQRDAAGGFFDEALAHFNRLLLEEAFPDKIEGIGNIRLAAMYRRLHAAQLTALSLSGGGIRSGTFALGLLQGMARHNLLGEFDYLSTVSGGGYIGSWLTAWLHRHPGGIQGVTHDLSNSDPVSKIDPDRKPLQYLRNYSSFLTPKVGLLTADTWTFAGIYLRNLLLNWVVFIPLLIAALMLPRLVLTLTLVQPVEDSPTRFETVLKEKTGGEKTEAGSREVTPEQVQGLKEVPAAQQVVYEAKPLIRDVFSARGKDEDDKHIFPRHILLLIGFALGVWALAYIGFNRPGVREMLRERSRFWRDRSDQRGFLWWCLLPLLLSAVCLTTYWAWSREVANADKSVWYFLGFGLAFTFLAWLIASSVLRRIFHWKEIGLLELLAILGAGAIGGVFFWLLSSQQIGDPVYGYGMQAREVKGLATPFLWQVTHPPFPWTDWTRWTWSSWTTELYVCVGVPVFLLVFWAATTFFVGLSSHSRVIDDEDREWWARLGAWLLIASIAWVTFNALVIYGPLALLESPKLLAAVGGLSGLISVLVGRSALTPAREGAPDEKAQSKSGVALNLLGFVLPLLGAIFLAAFVALISLATTGITRGVALLAEEKRDSLEKVSFRGQDYSLLSTLTNIPDAPPPTTTTTTTTTIAANRGFDEYVEYITPIVPTPTPVPAQTPSATAMPCTALCLSPAEAEAAKEEAEKRKADAFVGAKIVHMNVLHHTSLWLTLALALLMLGLGTLLSRLINLNLFSLHAGYRNRMIRAFLGASRPPGERKPNPFTGFDPSDNLAVHELRPALLDEGDLLKPRKLAEALLDDRHPLSQYLSEMRLLENIKDEPSTLSSPSLVATLRSDLNVVLEKERLYEQGFAQEFLQTKRAKKSLEGMGLSPGVRSKRQPPLRSDYHILLNRLVLEEAYPRTIKPAEFPPPPYKLLHVVNTSLNLVGGDNLAWQQRKAEPFSISPLHSGCFRLGYRRSRDYGGRDTGGISVGTAAAISGAAVSSNMGYYTTSPVISLLLTLFNVRLGWWLGNPGPAGNDTYYRRSPKYSVAPVVSEAFGLTDDRNKYVYLTDGGHFENLAVYEMVLRRCRFVVVADGAEDGEYRFGDLGNAVRKIRIDLGVTIDFPCVDIYDKQTAEEKKRRGMYWALGRIRYSCVDGTKEEDDGVMLYIKPAVYGGEPRDVLEYKESFPSFPHQSTGDQFFDEPQFESYRMLGSYIMDQLCGPNFAPRKLPEVIGRAGSELLERCGVEVGEGFIRLDDDFKKWLQTLSGSDYRVEGPRLDEGGV